MRTGWRKPALRAKNGRNSPLIKLDEQYEWDTKYLKGFFH